MSATSPDLDQTVEALAVSFYRRSHAIIVGVVLTELAIVAAVFLTTSDATAFGFAARVGVLALGVTLIVARFDLQARTVLEIDRDPDAVREEFAALVNPQSAFGLAWADDVRELDDVDATTAVQFEGTMFRVFDATYQYRTWCRADGTVDVAFDDSTDASSGEYDSTATVTIEPTAGGSRVTVQTTVSEKDATGVLNRLLEGRYHRRVNEAFGYDVVSTDGTVTPTTRFS